MPFHRVVRAAALALVFPLSACSGGGGGTFVLGLAAPLERSFGENSRLAAELAVREINEAGGIGGRRLELRIVDDRAEESVAITVAQQLYDDPAVLAVVGHATSGPMVAASGVYQQGLPALGTSATSTEVSEMGEWVFRIASSDSANAASLAALAAGLGRRAAILYSNDDYGRSLAQVFERSLSGTGATLVGRFPYIEEMKDFTPFVRLLQQRGAEVVLVAGLEVGAATMIQQAQAIGWNPRFIGGDGLEPLVDMGARYDGTLVGVLYHPEMSPGAQKFAAAFRAAYNREPDSSAATSYDAVQLLARALREGRTTRPAIREYLERVGREGGSPPFEGVAGPVAFDANGDPVGKPVALVRIQGGRFRLQQGTGAAGATAMR